LNRGSVKKTPRPCRLANRHTPERKKAERSSNSGEGQGASDEIRKYAGRRGEGDLSVTQKGDALLGKKTRLNSGWPGGKLYALRRRGDYTGGCQGTRTLFLKGDAGTMTSTSSRSTRKGRKEDGDDNTRKNERRKKLFGKKAKGLGEGPAVESPPGGDE